MRRIPTRLIPLAAAILTLPAAAAWAQLPGDRAGPPDTPRAPEERPIADPLRPAPAAPAEARPEDPLSLAEPERVPRTGPPGLGRVPEDAPASMVPGMERTGPRTDTPVPPAGGTPPASR